MSHRVTAKQIQKIAVVDIEIIDEPHITEINVFVVDVLNIINFSLIEGN